MRLALGAGLIASALLGRGTCAAGLAAHDAALGNYKGSGRACYGMLTITTRRIAWTTPFSRCAGAAYEVRDRREDGDGIRVTFVLSRPGAGCRYPVLELTRRPGDDLRIGWEIAGYPSLDSLDRGSNAERIGCYLYR